MIPDPPADYKRVILPFENVPMAIAQNGEIPRELWFAYYCPVCSWVFEPIAVWYNGRDWWYKCAKCQQIIDSHCEGSGEVDIIK